NAVSSASNIMGIATNATDKKQTEGSISIVFLKDPTDPRWKNDPGIKLYRSIMKKYKGVQPNDVYNVYGMSVAHTFVEALKKAGRSPTRTSIMKAVTHLNVHNDPFLLPGIVVPTTATPPLSTTPAKAGAPTIGRTHAAATSPKAKRTVITCSKRKRRLRKRPKTVPIAQRVAAASVSATGVRPCTWGSSGCGSEISQTPTSAASRNQMKPRRGCSPSTSHAPATTIS